MLNKDVFYWGIIRKTIVAFGNLFSEIYIDRKQGDSVAGATIQRLQIPLSYSPREKWLVRIEQEPTIGDYTYTTLPRMAFEITGLNYDSTRKVGKMQKIVCNSDGSSTGMFSPVPYNIDISLYILTKTQEDALQIVEQILPNFGPEYTMSINAVPQMNLIQDIPVTLGSVSANDEYDGDFQTRRFVTYTLTFTLKINLFGPASSSKPIYHVDANISTESVSGPFGVRFHADGDPGTGVVTESWVNDF